MKIIISAYIILILKKEAKALVIPTFKLPGNEQMALDLHFLDQTIYNPEIFLTIRFYYWSGDWLSLGYHQKKIPPEWERLINDGIIRIVRRPSGGGAVLHSNGITYSITFKKSYYKNLSYEMINNWLIKSFKELGLILTTGHIRKSIIKENCFGTSYISDLVNKEGFKLIGSAQYRKKGAFLQHGEIQINPPRALWLSLFGEEAPPKINLNLTNDEIIEYLKNSFLENQSNLKIKNLNLKKQDIYNFLNS